MIMFLAQLHSDPLGNRIITPEGLVIDGKGGPVGFHMPGSTARQTHRTFLG